MCQVNLCVLLLFESRYDLIWCNARNSQRAALIYAHENILCNTSAMFSCFSSLESDGDVVYEVLFQALNLHAPNWPCLRKICHHCNSETSELEYWGWTSWIQFVLQVIFISNMSALASVFVVVVVVVIVVVTNYLKNIFVHF